MSYSPSLLFNLQWVFSTVLTCGDKPEIDHVTSTPSTESPWFPGTIINYPCEDTNYQLKYNSTSECKVDGTEAKWVNQSAIRCSRKDFMCLVNHSTFV